MLVLLNVFSHVLIKPLVIKSLIYVSNVTSVWQHLQTTFCLEHLEVFDEPIGMDVAIGFVCAYEPYIVCDYSRIVHNIDFGPQMLDQGFLKQVLTKACVVLLKNSLE